ncbi:hypothetical protein LMG31885_45510 (plasmid) [Xanthomonas hydrangeae]|nr:hypothetical protein LMG31885_45510 [Xanthomonas hydrangeae]CAD7748269.1 hypothetical protein LMG31885_45510 [Xanthomonas hydrangeae]
MSLRPTDARQNYAPVLDRIFQRSCRVLTVGRTAPLPSPAPAKPPFSAQSPCPPRRQQSHPALLLPNRFSRRSRRALPGVSNLTLPYSCQTTFPGAAAVSSPASAISPCPTPAKPLFPAQPPCPPRRQQSHPALLLPNRFSRRSRRVPPGVSNLTLPYSCQTAFPGAAAVSSPASAISPCPTPAKPLFPAQPPCLQRRQDVSCRPHPSARGVSDLC